MDTDSLLTESGRAGRKESSISKRVEKATSSLPSSFFLVAAAGAVALSLGLATSRKKKNWANFVGQWVPTILLLGIYDKMVRTPDANKAGSKSSLLH